MQRETGMHWKTLKKVLEHSKPPGYRQERQRPKRKTRPLEERGREVSVLAGRARMPLVLSVERKLGLRARCQLHSNPHGQGFMAATSMNCAGKVSSYCVLIFVPMNEMCARAGVSERQIFERTKAFFGYFNLPFAVQG